MSVPGNGRYSIETLRKQLRRKRGAVSPVQAFRGHLRYMSIRQQEWLDSHPDDPHGFSAYEAMTRHQANAIGWASRD